MGGERSALTTAPSLAPQRYFYEGRKPETISFCDYDMRWIQLWKFVSLLVDSNAEREVCKLSYADWRLYVRIQVQNKYKGNTSDHLPSPSPYLFLLPPSSVDILEKNEWVWVREICSTDCHTSGNVKLAQNCLSWSHNSCTGVEQWTFSKKDAVLEAISFVTYRNARLI